MNMDNLESLINNIGQRVYMTNPPVVEEFEGKWLVHCLWSDGGDVTHVCKTEAEKDSQVQYWTDVYQGRV